MSVVASCIKVSRSTPVDKNRKIVLLKLNCRGTRMYWNVLKFQFMRVPLYNLAFPCIILKIPSTPAVKIYSYKLYKSACNTFIAA